MVSQGTATINGASVRVSDTPGLNSLHACSEDELAARNVLLNNHAIVAQVADAKNLCRALTLTLELAETGCPMLLCLNMMDEARERRLAIDVQRLTAVLDIPVMPTVAIEGAGVEQLRRAIPQARRSRVEVSYPPVIAEAVTRMVACVPEHWPARKAVALLWLAGDRELIARMTSQLEPFVVQRLEWLAARAQEQSAVPLRALIARAKLREAKRITALVTTSVPAERHRGLERAGDLAMHPVWGMFILVGVLALMYVIVGDLAAQRAVGWMEDVVFGRFVTPSARWLITHAIPWTWLQQLFVGEYGLLTMALPYALAIILPIVGAFFFCFGLIEDVGYLPRLAVMANRACRLLGLNGKAVLPLVLGLGCDTMATMTARILDTKRDRIIVTLLLALGIPCSAQLGVIMAMLAGRPLLALGIWLAVVLGVIILVGQLATRVLPGETSPFLYEVPPLRRPRLSNVLVKTLGRLEWYVTEAVPLFFLGTLVLFVLDASGALAVIERWATPLVVTWLGLPAKATAALLIGFLRRDFGAAGLFALQRAGELDGVQTVTSLVTITLFVPCIAQYFMMVKERGWKMATGMAVFVTGLALGVGGVVHQALRALRISL